MSGRRHSSPHHASSPLKKTDDRSRSQSPSPAFQTPKSNSQEDATNAKIASMEREKELLNLRNPQHLRRFQILNTEIQKLMQTPKAHARRARVSTSKETETKNNKKNRKKRAPSLSKERKKKGSKQSAEQLEEYSPPQDEDDIKAILKNRHEGMDKIINDLLNMKKKVAKLAKELEKTTEKYDRKTMDLKGKLSKTRRQHEETKASVRQRLERMRFMDTVAMATLSELLRLTEEGRCVVGPDEALNNMWFICLEYGFSVMRYALFTFANLRDRFTKITTPAITPPSTVTACSPGSSSSGSDAQSPIISTQSTQHVTIEEKKGQ